VRTERDPGALASAVRREIQSQEPGLALAGLQTMDDVVGDLLWAPRAGAALLALFGGLALALAVIGIYGVMSYSVAQRHREIAIRMAVGAGRGQVIRLFLGRGMALVAAGIGLGLFTAFAGARWIASLLYGIEPGNATAFAGAALGLAAVALAATWLPARRAAAVPPMLALRQGGDS
jgi:ABC-type antimicrobial peptide transport system permease subunit